MTPNSQKMNSEPVKRVILLEDDEDLASLLQIHLTDAGVHVIHFQDGQLGYEYALANPFDLMVLDISLPGMNGLDVCAQLRANFVNSPILMLTARTEEIDKVLGLETGADDYMTKPFGVRELMARVKALLRRVEMDRSVEAKPAPLLTFRDMEVDRNKRSLYMKEHRVELTPKEFDLICLLASNPGVTFDRKELLDKVWGYNYEGYEHTVNSHINRLRSKIEEDPNNPTYVLTTWGVGYRFTD